MEIESHYKIIQPTYHNPQIRTVFSLGNMKMSSDISLGGVKSTDPTKEYVASIGAWSLIDKLYLYDGEILLSSNENVAYWMSFLALNHGNSDNISKYSKAYRSKGGFKVASNGKYNFSDNLQYVIENSPAVDGWLNLKDALWMLKYTPLLQFQNLRLVIEWNTSEFGAAAGSSAAEPSLQVLEIIGQKVQMKPFEYYDLEVDRSKIDAEPTDGKVQTKELNIEGFNNKIVSRLLIGFQGAASDAAGIGTYFYQYASVQQPSESIQLYNSNIPITPSAITDQNKLAYLEGSWGPINLPTGTQLNTSLNQRDAIMASNELRGLFQAYGWAGIDVDSSQPIVNLRMKYQRTAGGVAQHQQALNVHVFALVKKFVGENKSDQSVVGDL